MQDFFMGCMTITTFLGLLVIMGVVMIVNAF